MPDLIRHPEGLERTGFRLEFIPMKIGVGMTTFIKAEVYGQTLIRCCHNGRWITSGGDDEKKRSVLPSVV
jgi:hypothetical protein